MALLTPKNNIGHKIPWAYACPCPYYLPCLFLQIPCPSTSLGHEYYRILRGPTTLISPFLLITPAITPPPPLAALPPPPLAALPLPPLAALPPQLAAPLPPPPCEQQGQQGKQGNEHNKKSRQACRCRCLLLSSLIVVVVLAVAAVPLLPMSLPLLLPLLLPLTLMLPLSLTLVVSCHASVVLAAARRPANSGGAWVRKNTPATTYTYTRTQKNKQANKHMHIKEHLLTHVRNMCFYRYTKNACLYAYIHMTPLSIHTYTHVYRHTCTDQVCPSAPAPG